VPLHSPQGFLSKSMTHSKVSKGSNAPSMALFGLLVGALAAQAQQDAVAPLPTSINAILQQAGIPLPPPAEDPSSIASVDRPESPFQYPPFTLNPHLYYRFLYEYGVQVRPNHPETTLIDTFAPGITVEIGPQWTIDYTANWDVYSNSAFKNTLGHSVSIVGMSTLDDWTVKLTQGYVYSSEPLVETAVQTTEQDYKTAIDISRELGRQFLTETVLNQDLRYALLFTDSYQWSVDEWLHYRFTAQLDAAVGGSAGYVHESHGSDSNYTRPETEISWQPTEKIEITANGGLEHRVFLDYPRTSLDTPTYDLSAQYSPFQTTKFILDFVHEVSPSLFANESTRISREDLGLTQRLLGKIFLTGKIGHDVVSYISTGQTNGIARNDAQTTMNLSLSTSFLKRGTVSLVCYRTRNSSTDAGFGFVTTQFGVDLSYRY
jgi:hypothetical protein